MSFPLLIYKTQVMKNQFCLLFCLFYTFSHLYSQPEKQWLIWNRLGKNGINTSNQNVYPTSPAINLGFTLSGVRPADFAHVPGARNDLFIIYTDGTNLNSRYVTPTGPGFFYTSSDINSAGVAVVMNHSFKKPSGAGVGYLYLTNRYEEDDLPASVKAVSSQLSSAPNTYILPASTSPALSASHEVVYNKDITLIVDHLRLNPDNSKRDTFELLFDGIRNRTTGIITGGHDFLDPSKVFGTNLTSLSAVYPGMPSPSGTAERILFTSANNFSYINLKPNNNITAYGPDISDTLGKPRYDALFTVTRNGVPIAQLPEPIRISHDPNFLRVESICRTSDGGYLIKYHLQFENVSETLTSTLSAEVDFPSQFDLSCVQAINWSAKGAPCLGDVHPPTSVPRRYTFDIEDKQLARCTPTAPHQGIGWIEFVVKLNPGIDPANLATSLHLDNPTVYFDSRPFPIEEFRDLIICDYKGSEIKDSSKFYQDTNIYNDEGDNKNKKTLKEGSEVSNDFEDWKIQDVPKVEVRCYRPIVSGNCNCKTRTGVPIWLYGVLALVGISLLYFLLKKKKVTAHPSTTP